MFYTEIHVRLAESALMVHAFLTGRKHTVLPIVGVTIYSWTTNCIFYFFLLIIVISPGYVTCIIHWFKETILWNTMVHVSTYLTFNFP